MEKIGHKMLAFILALCLIIPASSVFAIDGEGMEEVEQPQIEEIKEEAPIEEPKEEVKEEPQEEVKEVKEETKKEIKAVKQENATKETQVKYPIKITWHIKYRDAEGKWTEFKSSLTDTLVDNHSTLKYPKPFSVLQSKVVKGKLYNAEEDKTYEFNNKYIDDYGNSYVTLIKAIAAGTDYEGTNTDNIKIRVSQSTDIYFTAQYNEIKPVRNLTGIYSDQIGHTSGSWATVNNEGTISYTHTFKDAADVPKNYRFVYWKNYEDGDEVNAGESRTWDLTALDQDTEVTYKATYQPIITMNYYDEKGILIQSVTNETIEIYNDCIAPKKDTEFLGWYRNDSLISKDVIKHLDLTTVEVQTDFDVYAKYAEPEPIPDPIPEVEPTPEPTPVAPTKPTEPKKDNTVTKKQTTTTITTTTETRVISPLPTPKAAKPIIEDSKIPLAKPQGTWALLNLILTIISCLIAIILLFVKKKSENDEYTDEEEKDIRSMRRFKFFSILFSIVSIIVFIFTEDMTMPMVWIDKWTILMAIFTGIEIANIFIIRQKAQEEETEEEEIDE